MRLFFATILFCFIFINNSFAQNALVDLHFEEAEKAYNQRNYSVALSKLDQVEQAVGPMSKTLYLRILTQDKMVAQGKHDDKKRDLLEELKDNAKTYLDIMSEYGIDDKFRAVYAIQEKYQNYDGSATSLISAEYAVADDYQLPDIFLDSYDFLDESRFYQLYPSGQLVAKGERKDGKPVGTWEWRDKTDNRLWRSVTYLANGSIHMNEYTKGHFQAALANTLGSALSQTAANVSSRSALGIAGGKQKKGIGSSDLLGAIQQRMNESVGTDANGSSYRSIQLNSQGNTGVESYGEDEKLVAKKSWREKNGRKIQEIDIYNEHEQIEYKVLYIDGSPVMRIPYENGVMVSEARTAYNQTLRNL